MSTEKMKDDSTFSYEYSAEKTREVEQIVSKYVPKEKDKLTELKELDASVEKKATIKAIVIGLIGIIIFGIGMCGILEFGGFFFYIGIVVGLIGMGVMGLALPIYKNTLKKERELIAPQIIALSKEIANN